MKKLALTLISFFISCVSVHAQGAQVVQSCGSVPSGSAYTSLGAIVQPTIDITGRLCSTAPAAANVIANVDSLGAAGNGTTDDTAIFTTALAACSGKGGVVQLGPHPYLINSANLTVPSNCKLQGTLQQGPRNHNANWATWPYQIILNPSFTINTGVGSTTGGAEISGVVIRNSAVTQPQTFRQGIQALAQFSGTAITVKSPTHLTNVTILGFATCVTDSATGQYQADNVYTDCSQFGQQLTNCGDVCYIHNSEQNGYVTANLTFTAQTVSAVSNSSGLYQLTITDSTQFVVGDTIFVGAANINALNGRWTISSIPDATDIVLSGSVFGGPTTTGTTTFGLTVVPVASTANIAAGQAVTGTGVQASTTVLAVWPAQNLVWLSLPINSAGVNTGVSLTFADPTYSASSANVNMQTLLRPGAYGFYITNGQALISNSGSEGTDYGFYFGTGSQESQCTNCWTDNPMLVGVWFDGTASADRVTVNMTSPSTGIRNTSSGTSANIVNGGTTQPWTSFYGTATVLEHSGTNALVVEGMASTLHPNFFYVADGAGQLSLTGNDFVRSTAYVQSLADYANISGVNNNFATGIWPPLLPSGAGSMVVNGDMRIDQAHEGASVSNPANAALLLDRWRVLQNLGGVAAFQRITDAPVAAPSNTSMKVTAGAGSTATATQYYTTYTGLQLNDTVGEGLQWGTNNAQSVELDFCIKSSLTGTFGYFVQNNAQNMTFTDTYSYPAANAWTCYQKMIQGAITGGWGVTPSIRIGFDLGSGSNFETSTLRVWQASNFYRTSGAVQVVANAAATWQVTAVHLRQTTVPGGPYQPLAYADELLRAQQFYQKSFPAGTAPAQSAGVAGARCINNPIANGQPSTYISLNPPLTASPTITTYNPSAANANWRDVTAAADVTVSVDPVTAKSSTGFQISAGATVTTINDNLCLHWVADSGN